MEKDDVARVPHLVAPLAYAAPLVWTHPCCHAETLFAISLRGPRLGESIGFLLLGVWTKLTSGQQRKGAGSHLVLCCSVQEGERDADRTIGAESFSSGTSSKTQQIWASDVSHRLAFSLSFYFLYRLSLSFYSLVKFSMHTQLLNRFTYTTSSPLTQSTMHPCTYLQRLAFS